MPAIILDNIETENMLRVRNLNTFMNKDEHMKNMRGNLDRMKKFAQDKFGYKELNINHQ
jgi:hypothetical protein